MSEKTNLVVTLTVPMPSDMRAKGDLYVTLAAALEDVRQIEGVSVDMKEAKPKAPRRKAANGGGGRRTRAMPLATETTSSAGE